MDDTELSGQKEKDSVGEQRTETQLHVALTSMVRHHIICLCVNSIASEENNTFKLTHLVVSNFNAGF